MRDEGVAKSGGVESGQGSQRGWIGSRRLGDRGVLAK
jgi:hypothetical protein